MSWVASVTALIRSIIGSDPFCGESSYPRFCPDHGVALQANGQVHRRVTVADDSFLPRWCRAFAPCVGPGGIRRCTVPGRRLRGEIVLLQMPHDRCQTLRPNRPERLPRHGGYLGLPRVTAMTRGQRLSLF